MLVGIKRIARAINLGGTAGTVSRPIVDGSFYFSIFDTRYSVYGWRWSNIELRISLNE